MNSVRPLPKHRQKLAVHGEDIGDAESIEHREVHRVGQGRALGHSALLDGPPALLQIGRRDRWTRMLHCASQERATSWPSAAVIISCAEAAPGRS